MKKKKKIKLKELCQTSEGGKKPEVLTTEHYFTSPIYWTDKPEWVKDLNTASDAYIKQARLIIQMKLKKEIKNMETKGNIPGFITLQL